jgi:hypothetical protein
MKPKEKAEAIVNKMFVKLGGKFGDKNWEPIVWQNTLIYDNAKKVCDEMVTEILTSFVINLTDYQTDFWIEVQKEIEKL